MIRGEAWYRVKRATPPQALVPSQVDEETRKPETQLVEEGESEVLKRTGVPAQVLLYFLSLAERMERGSQSFVRILNVIPKEAPYLKSLMDIREAFEKLRQAIIEVRDSMSTRRRLLDASPSPIFSRRVTEILKYLDGCSEEILGISEEGWSTGVMRGNAETIKPLAEEVRDRIREYFKEWVLYEKEQV